VSVRSIWLAGLAMLALALFASTASAATIVVQEDVDSNSFDASGCGLREAVEAANLNTDFGGCNGDTAGADTIVLQSGHTYDLNNFGPVDDSNGTATIHGTGDLDVKGPLTIRADGSGLATIAGNASGPLANRDRVIQVHDPGGPLTLDHLKITGGWVQQAGSVGGGGILSAQPLTITNSEITGNHVEAATAATLGAGIYVRGPLGSLNISNSAITANTGQAAGGGETVGGGIAAYDGATSLTMTNDTISGNTVTGAAAMVGAAGGVFAGDGGHPVPATLSFNTITANQALNPGGSLTGGIEMFSGTMTGNIVAGNTDPFDASPDCYGFPTSGGRNVIGDPGDTEGCDFTGLNAGPNDLVGMDVDNVNDGATVNANLGALVNNGGPTPTRALNPGSPAINRGGTCPATDQRGFFRAPAAPCDSGAFEVGATPTLPGQQVAGLITGQRDAALKKCKKKHSKKARKKCRKKANKLPA
jgi:hypothetical protein